MTGATSRSPLGEVAWLADLGDLGENLGGNSGESLRVCRLQRYPGWIYKEYRAPVPPEDVRRLTRLIQLPEQMTPARRALVDEHTAWPTTRVIDAERQTIGVLMPLAPAIFSTFLQMPRGRSISKLLEIDMLALTEKRQAELRFPAQSLADRISVCASIAAIGTVFECQGLAYLDWSYANVLWSLLDHSAYVIDLDGCSFGPRPQIQTPKWDDPLVPRGRDAGNESDRYRVALLTARCLTGRRATLAETRGGLFELRRGGEATGEVAGLLLRALNTRRVAERPSVAELSAALEAANKPKISPNANFSPLGSGGVARWKPLPNHGTSKSETMVPPPPKRQAPGPLITPSPEINPTSIPNQADCFSNYELPWPPNTMPRWQLTRRPTGATILFVTILVILLLIML